MSTTKPLSCEDLLFYKPSFGLKKYLDSSMEHCDFQCDTGAEIPTCSSVYNGLIFSISGILEIEKNFENVITEIERIEELLWDLYEKCNEEDWDCYGAIPIEKSIINRSIMFLKQVPNEILAKLTNDNFCPNPHGTITIEFFSEKGFIQIEIGLSKINIIGDFEQGESPEEFTWENFSISRKNISILIILLTMKIYSE